MYDLKMQIKIDKNHQFSIKMNRKCCFKIMLRKKTKKNRHFRSDKYRKLKN